MTTSALALLHDFIVRCAPSALWICGFLGQDPRYQPLLKELPDASASVRAYVDLLVDVLSRRGLIDDYFLNLLERDFPEERAAINNIRCALSLPMQIEEIVTFDALMDNWTAQEIAFLFRYGPNDDMAQGVQVTPEAILWPPEFRTGIALEGLLSLLSTVILHDKIIVEEEYAYVWEHASTPLLGLAAGGILVPVPKPPKLRDFTTPLYRELYGEGALQVAHRTLVGHIRETGEYPDNYASQVLWGTAGYLARSAAFGIAYTPHPIRRRFLAQTPFSRGRSDAGAIVLGAIEEVQATRLSALADDLVHDVHTLLPPLILRVLREARTSDEIILVALQMREEFRDVRTWIAHFQRALRGRDRPRILEYQSALERALVPHRDPSLRGPLRHEAFARSVLGLPGNHRRVALILQTLFVDPDGEDPLDRLFRLFGVHGSLEVPLREHLRRTVLRPVT